MKLQIFQSQKGDCLLLESQDGKNRVLCDGGMAKSMRDVVRAELGKLRTAKKKLDAVYVSHIDQDHISGVLALLEDEVTWRVYDYRKGRAGVTRPKVPRPPEIKALWHNSFSAQLGDLTAPVSDLLAAAAPAMLATRLPRLMSVGEDIYDIATSIPEAIQVSRLAAPEMLGIPLNKLPGQKSKPKLLMLRDKTKAFKIGAMKFTLIGPRQEELEELKEDWSAWLRDNKARIREIDRKLKEKMERMGANGLAAADFSVLAEAEEIVVKGVTTPNLASLMFLVEEDGKRLLLTGDSAGELIVNGLKETGFLKDGHLHVDVLKVQHHGATANLKPDFARQISADHYVFCGNGEHDNPEEKVIDIVFNSRCGKAADLALAPQAAGRPFTLWFSTTGDGKADAHMRKIRKKVEGLAGKSNGRMKVKFNTSASITLSI